jgi:hypothetical protein
MWQYEKYDRQARRLSQTDIKLSKWIAKNAKGYIKFPPRGFSIIKPFISVFAQHFPLSIKRSILREFISKAQWATSTPL